MVMELGLGSQQNGVLVNRTRAAEALSHLLDTSRRTIIQVEALVTVAAVLLFLQLVLGTWKRRWHNSVVSGALSLFNALLPPLILYTLSTMQSSPVKNSMYPVWGASLLLAAGGTIPVSGFSYGAKGSKETMNMARYGFYFFMLVMLLSPYTLKESFFTKPKWHREITGSRASSMCISNLLAVLFITKGIEIVGLSFSHTLFIWANKNAFDHQNDTDPETMRCYNYPVGYAIRCLPRPKFQVITIDHIWDCCGNSSHGEKLEEVCLSLALCQSLIPRFRWLSSAEARLPANQDSVFNELLQTESDYKRAFRIIEVELGFCYDFFFTKYPSIFFATAVYFPFFLCRVILFTLVLVYTVQDSMTILTPDPIIQVHITRTDYIITLVLLGTALLVELLQALVYMASDWIKVSLACQYVRHKQNAFLEKFLGFLSKVAVFPKRRNRNKIAQYTVVLGDNSFSMCTIDPVKISRDIEKAIAESIKSTFGEQTNRLASLVRNSMFEDSALKDHWTLKNHSQVEIMLIWHIATDYCHISPSSGNGVNPDRDVAVTLSRYCAYLIAFVPELLPYHVDRRKLIPMLNKEIPENLPSSRPSERYREMKELGDDPPTVFRKGVKLGKQLEDMLDEAQRWKVMADFWAKTIIYIAPSHITAKEHMRRLENGGEFLTHIWALLSHAGILNLVRDDDEVAKKPAQPTQ